MTYFKAKVKKYEKKYKKRTKTGKMKGNRGYSDSDGNIIAEAKNTE